VARVDSVSGRAVDTPTPSAATTTTRASRFTGLDYATEQLGVASFVSLEVGQGYGQYAMYMIDKPQVTRGVLLDPTGRVPRDQLLTAIERAAERPGMQVLDDLFWDPETIGKIGKVDTVVLYDVLMRLVGPNWDQVLELYAPSASSFVICNPQWESEGDTVRLIDLGRERYLEVAPPWPAARALFDEPHTWPAGEPRPSMDGPHVWQWGITDRDLKAKASELGFTEVREWILNRPPDTAGFVTKVFVFARA
jgi:hypothetical protein